METTNTPFRQRRRRADTCTPCKRKKAGCDGTRPACTPCLQQGRGERCSYGKPKSRSRIAPQTRATKRRRSRTSSTSSAEYLSPRSPVSRPQSTDSSQTAASVTGQVPFSTSPYISTSAIGSFVNDIKAITEAAVGANAFSCARLDTYSSNVCHDAGETTTLDGLTSYELHELLDLFIKTTIGFCELFRPGQLLIDLQAWHANPQSVSHVDAAIYSLVLAIGSRSRQTAPGQPDHFWAKAQDHLAQSDFEPSLSLIRVHALTAIYYITLGQHDLSHTSSVKAIRVAEALDLQSAGVNVHFHASEHLTRHHIWQSLRLLNIFLSISLGRPLAYQCSDVESAESSRLITGGDIGEDWDSRATAQLCDILEHIVRDVYNSPGLTVQKAQAIAARLCRWSQQYQLLLSIPLSISAVDSPKLSVHELLQLVHLKCLYYFSAVLIARPFFLEAVSSNCTGQSDPDEQRIKKVFVDACVFSSAQICAVADELRKARLLSARFPLIADMVFVGSLVFGAAFFANLDITLPVQTRLREGARILAHLGEDDITAHRYHSMVLDLIETVNTYAKQRNHASLLARRAQINNLFGQLGQQYSADYDVLGHTRLGFGNQQRAQDSQDYAEQLSSMGLPAFSAPLSPAMGHSAVPIHNQDMPLVLH